MNGEPDGADRDPLAHVLLPVASEEDALATATALEPYRPDRVTALHAVEKAGGAPDKTPVEQSEEVAAESYAAVRTVFPDAEFDHATLAGAGGLAPFGTGAILPATALVFVSFLGYAKIATVAEELQNPGRNLPIAIIGSVGIVTVIYAILVTMMLGVVPWPGLSLDAPVARAAEVSFPASIGPIGGVAAAAAAVMTAGALLATASSANASILASARINSRWDATGSSPTGSTGSTPTTRRPTGRSS